MARKTEEWIGKDDDTQIPPRVRLRVFDRYDGRCYLCTRKIGAGEYWEADHVIALCNGGANREGNLKPACCNCCRPKTADDVSEKSIVYEKRTKHLGIKKSSRSHHRPRGSVWKKKIGGAVVRR